MTNINSAIVQRNLNFFYSCLAEDNMMHLLELGLTEAQVVRLQQMSLSELHRFSELSTSTGLIKMSIEPAAYDQAIKRLEREAEDLRLQDELLLAGAPTPMMHHFFGLTNQECALRRRHLGIVKESGRPRLPTEEKQNRIWESWNELSDLDDVQRFLRLSEISEESLHNLWSLINKWRDEGTLGSMPSRGRDKKHHEDAAMPVL